MAKLHSHGVIGLSPRLAAAFGFRCHPSLDTQPLSTFVHNLGGATTQQFGTCCKAQMGCVRLSWLFGKLAVVCRMLIALGCTTEPADLDFSDSGIWQNYKSRHEFIWTTRQPNIGVFRDLAQGSCSNIEQYMSHALGNVISCESSRSGCTEQRYHACQLVVASESCFVNALGRQWTASQTLQWHHGTPYRTSPMRQTFSRYFYVQQRRACAISDLCAVKMWSRSVLQRTPFHGNHSICGSTCLHNCSQDMAQSRAVFLQGGVAMETEGDVGPDPLGRPPLPRRRRSTAPDGEIEVRPPLPRRKPPQTKMVELTKARTETRDLEHMQLAEAVEVIAKSED